MSNVVFFFNSLVLFLLKDTFMQFLYVLQFFFFFSRRISHFRSPLLSCVRLFVFFFVVVVVVVVVKYILAWFSTFK